MQRRTILKSSLAGAVALAAPRIGRAQGASLLKFIPQADLASVDPVWTTADVTRNHAFLVYDNLFGLDAHFIAQPQMVAGHTVSSDKLTWELTLRDGLKFHDGTPVLARDCVASIERWGQRDVFGQGLMARTEELSAPSDKVIRFRLKTPFALLPAALADTGNMCCIMPERLAKTPATQQVTDVVGSGPFRFVPKERVAGSRVVYEKFADYVPRQGGETSFCAGPKVVHFDRVVWTVVPDPSTASAALSSDEYDWWENPTIDLIPMLKRDKNLTIVVKDHFGEIGCMRFNCLFPPFDNPAIRRVVLSAINQREFMEAVAGADPELIKTPVGAFVPSSPYASDVGLEMFKKPKSAAEAKKDLQAAGYKGEKVVVLAASDFPTINAEAEVGGDLLKRIGLNVDYQALDWGTVVQRRASKQPVDKGGWNIFFTFLGGTGNISPAASVALRENGDKAWFGWPTGQKMESLREQWFAAADLDAAKKIAGEMQAQLWQDAPYCPLGMYEQPTAFTSKLKDIPEGFPLFYGVRRT